MGACNIHVFTQQQRLVKWEYNQPAKQQTKVEDGRGMGLKLSGKIVRSIDNFIRHAYHFGLRNKIFLFLMI